MTILKSANLWRNDFAILQNSHSLKKLIYMDSAATTLKPRIVADAVGNYYSHYTSNIGRSSHFLSEIVCDLYESSREKVASFINARKDEIIFTHNCTAAINLVAKGLNLSSSDEILLSVLEHHSNYLPWQENATIKVIPIGSDGLINIDYLYSQLSEKTKLIAITHISNVTGNIQPVKEIAKIARENGILCLIDAAQAVGHIPVDVFDIDCDFLVFSGHKMLAPTGVGVLYVKNEVMNQLKPTSFGGGMVNKVIPEIEYMHSSSIFESGTPNIEGVLGLGAAIDYVNEIGMDCISKHLDYLESYCLERLRSLDSIYIPFAITARQHSPIFSFRAKNSNISNTYLAQILSDSHGIAVREGYQCAQPLYHSRNIDGAIRVSLYLYNTIEEIDVLIDALSSLHTLIG